MSSSRRDFLGLEALQQFGIRVIQLTYNRRNQTPGARAQSGWNITCD